ncbi:MAG: C25 family cysteine peptidase [Flavobacteriales bacterium]
MVRSILLLLVLVRAVLAFGQSPYGNEWIDHDRQYWRFDVYSTALHRLDSATLAAAGFPIGTVDPKDLMLFGREKQVPLYIQGGEDGVLNSGDLIEFIGRKNDGWIDTRMYQTPEHHANPYYSQFNDTIHYFLTWDPDPEVVKERVQPYVNTAYDEHTIRPWVWNTSIRGLRDYYWLGYIYPQFTASSSQMIEGEGWGGNPLQTTSATVETPVSVATERAFTGAGAPMADVHMVIAGQTNPGGTSWIDHHVQVLAGAGGTVLMKDTTYIGSKVVRFDFQVPATDLTGGFNSLVRVPHDLDGPGQIGQFQPAYVDFQVPTAAIVRYARDLQIYGPGPLDFSVPADEDPVARLFMGNVTGTPVLYAFGDTIRRVLPGTVGGGWQALIPTHPDSAETRTFLYASESAINIPSLVPVNGDGRFTDYAAMDPDSALLIVSHQTLWNGAQAYANYRSSGGPRPLPTVLADVDELYDQFGGGVPKNSLAIRMWAKFVLDTWTTDPQGLFLIGKSVTTSPVGYGQGTRVDFNNSYARCLVPTYGYPPSDQCFTMGLHFDPRLVEIPVGRLSASDEQQVFDYLDKVQTFEALEHAAWMKNVVHLSGGFTAQEQANLANHLRNMEPYAGDTTSFGAQYARFIKSSSETFSVASADSVRQLIEGGVSLMNFFAHAYSENFDITIDDPDNYEWNGRYPMVIGNSCYIGNIHLNADLASTSEDWVMRPGKGPIAFMASVDEGIAPYLAVYSAHWYNSLGTANYGKGLGEHMRHAAYQYLNNQYNTVTLFTVQTFTLQGDPMLVLNSPEKPDFEVLSEDILFDPVNVTADIDSFDVKVVLRNIGRLIDTPVSVQLERTNSGLPEPIVTTAVEFRIPGHPCLPLAHTGHERRSGHQPVQRARGP